MSNDIKIVKAQILQKLNIRQEYEQMGVKFVGHPNKRGWNPCFNPYKSEQHPSCGINTVDDARLGQLVAFNINNGGGAVWCKSIFDVASDFVPGLGGEFVNALRYYAAKTGIELHAHDGNSNHKSKEIDRQYDYCDAVGALQYQVIRYKGRKNFMPRRPDPLHPSRWIYDLPEAMRLPYGLNKVAAADTVYIVEGEKDCQTLEARGLCASTNPFGAGKWLDGYNQYFIAKHIIILYDNDEPGRAHAQLVARNLQPVAASVKIIDLPGCENKEDVTDWFSKGHTLEELQQLVTSTAQLKQTPAEKIPEYLQELNDKHAAIMLGGKFLILTETFDSILKMPDIALSGVADFFNLYANRKVIDPSSDRMKSVAKLWLESPHRREYKSIIFDPSKPATKSGDYYNLYRGLAVVPHPGDWSLFRDHIYKIICSCNDDLYKWVLAWMARIVKYPGGDRPGTSIALRGKQGAGKGCFVSNFGKLFGPHFVHLTNQSQLVGHFNFHLKNALVVFADEGFWAGDKSAEGTLKGMVTEEIQYLTPKGKESFPVRNFINLIISSNHDWVVPAGLEERRFCVIDVSADKMQNTEYFEAIKKQMNHGGREAMLDDLLKLDISQENLRKIPITDALLEQKMNSMGPVGNFWEEVLLDGILLKKETFDDWPERITVKSLHDEFLDYCSKMKTRYPINSVHFSRKLHVVCPNIISKQINYAGKNNRSFIIPNLSQCRIDFESVVGKKIDWDFDSENDI